MAGVLEFKTLQEAIQNGFTPYDRLNGGGWLVKKRTAAGWALAFVARENHSERGPAPCND